MAPLHLHDLSCLWQIAGLPWNSGERNGKAQANFLQEEISFLRTTGPGEVFVVQARIVGQVLRLVQQGQINLPAGQSG